MSRFPKLLLAYALGLLAACAGLGLLIAAPPADAQVLASVGTPTLPPAPSPEPPTATAVPATSTATAVPAISTATAAPPTSTATAVAPTNTPASPTSTATAAPPTHTAVPTSTPARPTLTTTATTPPPTTTPTQPGREPPTGTAAPPTQTAAPTEPPRLDLELAKAVDRAEAAPGDELLYTLAVRNLSAQPAADVQVSDTLPAQLVALSAHSDRARVELSGQLVTAWLPALAPGELAEIQIAARVRADAPAGELVNTARVTSSTPGDPTGNNTSSVPVQVRARAIERLPRTAYAPDLPLTTVPPLVWAALVGGLLFTLGGALSWGLRGWMRRPHAQREPSLRPIGASRAFRLPAPPQAGPARLGAPLPPALPPAPLPPLAQLDRDDVLRDVLGDEG